MPIRRKPERLSEAVDPNAKPSIHNRLLNVHLTRWRRIHKPLNPKHYGVATQIPDIHGKVHEVDVDEIEHVEAPEHNRRVHVYLKNGTVIVATLAAGVAAFKAIRMHQKHK